VPGGAHRQRQPGNGAAVSVAILQLRMKRNRIAEADLKALCDAIVLADAPVKESQRSKSQQGQRRRPAALLKLVD
jgi:hypothetical protein